MVSSYEMDSITVKADPTDSDKNEGEKKKSYKELFSTLGILVLAPIIAILLSMFVFQSYEVDGPSMENTLHNKDRLIVSKTARTWSRITGHAYIPDRYSIIVFNYNGPDGSTLEKKQLIKRVIGLPGDRIVIKSGIVTIYNSQHPEGFLPDRIGSESANANTQRTEGTVDKTINAGEVFLMGDNRGNSLDSRIFGPVKASDIVGHLVMRIYPFDTIKKF